MRLNRSGPLAGATLLVGYLFSPRLAYAQSCGCDIVVNPSTTMIDGDNIAHAPGDTICLMAGLKQSLRIVNFEGGPGNELVFKNCGGLVELKNSTGNYGISIQNSKHFRLTGTGHPSLERGIKVGQSGSMGVTIGGFSTDFEVDHVEIANVGFAGIMAKTDPSCSNRDLRYFVQRNTRFHDNEIHHTRGEGFYVGYFQYPEATKDCGGQQVKIYPHAVEDVAIYNNHVWHTGWDGIQLGSAPSGAAIYDNDIEDYGWLNRINQQSGIQVNSGVNGDVFNNEIHGGTGTGIVMFGTGGNVVYNNLIVDAGADGIFCDDRSTTPGTGFHFINNTIVTPADYGMRMYSDESVGNTFYNNIVAEPGVGYVYLLNSSIDWTESNNTLVATVAGAGFVDPASGDYHLRSDSPACDSGLDTSVYGVIDDLDGNPRAVPYEIGAYDGCHAQSCSSYFAQGFESSTSVSSYTGNPPSPGQFNDISAEANGGTWSISGGALRLVRTGSGVNNGAGLTRFTDVASSPPVLRVSFGLRVSSFNSFQNDALILDIGNISELADYNNGSVNANTFARLNVDGTGSNTFKFEMGGVRSPALAASGPRYSLVLYLNKSGALQGYTGPDGTSRSLANGAASLWVGSALVLDDIPALNGASSTLTDLRIRFSQTDSATWELDDFQIGDICF